MIKAILEAGPKEHWQYVGIKEHPYIGSIWGVPEVKVGDGAPIFVTVRDEDGGISGFMHIDEVEWIQKESEKEEPK